MSTYIWIFLEILLIGIAAGIWWERRKKPKLVIDQAKEKAQNMEKIRDMLERINKISNDDIQRETGVSDTTATTYMDELERMGEARQVGREGKYVYYERVN